MSIRLFWRDFHKTDEFIDFLKCNELENGSYLSTSAHFIHDNRETYPFLVKLQVYFLNNSRFKRRVKSNELFIKTA